MHKRCLLEDGCSELSRGPFQEFGKKVDTLAFHASEGVNLRIVICEHIRVPLSPPEYFHFA